MQSVESLMPVLRTCAVERAAQVPIRIFLALVLSWTLHVAGEGALIPLWLACSAAVQVFEYLAMAPFRKPSQPPPGRPQAMAALAAVFAMSAVHGAIALFIWSHGGAVATVAILILAGGLLTNVASGIESRTLFLLGAAPYFVVLGLMPALDAMARRGVEAALLMVAVMLFVGAVLAVWKRTHSSWKAEAVAREESQVRLIQAEQAMADRAAMAAIVSHELRTPVSAILAGAQVMRRQAPAGTEETADLIIDAGRLMTGMLNDLLDHSKIEARAMTLEERDFDIVALVRDTARFWDAPAAQKGLLFESEPGAEGPVWLHGDPHRLRQILNNLISNAIKFTGEGKVSLSLALGDEAEGLRRLRLTVKDQGAGIPPEAMERLFTPFTQASSAVARTYGGTGLGLTVSRDLARLMGGDISAQSQVGRGSMFFVDMALPVGRPVEALAPSDEAPELARRLKVLAVDDHEINRRTLALVLQPLDVDLVTAVDGQSALALLADRPFDVVLMDVNMPGISGRETTRRLRREGGPNAQVPVIGFSAATDGEEVAACHAAGMTGWIPKPLEPQRLYAELERVVSGAPQAA